MQQSAPKCNQNRLYLSFYSIITCSERHEKDGRISVVPLAPPSLLDCTKYTVLTGPSNQGEGARTRKNKLPPVITESLLLSAVDLIFKPELL